MEALALISSLSSLKLNFEMCLNCFIKLLLLLIKHLPKVISKTKDFVLLQQSQPLQPVNTVMSVPHVYMCCMCEKGLCVMFSSEIKHQKGSGLCSRHPGVDRSSVDQMRGPVPDSS